MEVELKLELQRTQKSLDRLNSRIEAIEKKINPAEKLLDSTDVMKLLGVSERTLATYRKSGIIEYVKIGGTIRYPQSSISKYLNLKL